MAKKPKVNKTQAVKNYLKAHPKAVTSEIAAALTKQGIKIAPSYVSNIKTTINKTRTAKAAARRQAKAVAAAHNRARPDAQRARFAAHKPHAVELYRA